MLRLRSTANLETPHSIQSMTIVLSIPRVAWTQCLIKTIYLSQAISKWPLSYWRSSRSARSRRSKLRSRSLLIRLGLNWPSRLCPLLLKKKRLLQLFLVRSKRRSLPGLKRLDKSSLREIRRPGKPRSSVHVDLKRSSTKKVRTTMRKTLTTRRWLAINWKTSSARSRTMSTLNRRS